MKRARLKMLNLPWLSALSFDRFEVNIILKSGFCRVITGQSLYDNRPSQLTPLSHQRLSPSQKSSHFVGLNTIAANSEGIIISFGSGETELYPHSFVYEKWLSMPLLAEPEAWDGQTRRPPPFVYDDFIHNDAYLLSALQSFLRYGYLHLKEAPYHLDEIETTIRRFSVLRETNYGRIFDVKPKPNLTNLADSHRGLEPHTDNPYRGPPPSIQILHVLKPADIGGETILVDGLSLIERLKKTHSEYLEILSSVPVRFGWRDADHDHTHQAPIIETNDTGNDFIIRFNHRSMIEPVITGLKARKWQEAYQSLSALIHDEHLRISLRLEEGDILIMNNHRILHGRSAFDDDQSQRWLKGAYIEMDGLKSKTRSLMKTMIEETIKTLSALFHSDGAHQFYGEDVSLINHMLQTASWLSENNEDEALIISGLLHDIGWLFEGNSHENSGADYLEAYFGPKISEPVRLHVYAKRYLVATQANYYDKLSDASKETLTKQGGPLDTDECHRFEQNPYFHQALKLRQADDEAKTMGGSPAPFAAYEPILASLIIDKHRTR